MDTKRLAELEERLLAVNKVVAKVDPAIRVAVFDFLKPYILGDAHSAAAARDLLQRSGPSLKPSDNLKLLTALWFNEYGSIPFSITWLIDTAHSLHLPIPARPEMTLRSCRMKGKKAFTAVGPRGFYAVTKDGEAILAMRYGVRRGTKTAPPHSLIENIKVTRF